MYFISEQRTEEFVTMIDGIKVWCVKVTVRVSTPRGCSSDAQLMIIESTSVVARMIIYSVSENQGTFSDYHTKSHNSVHYAVSGGHYSFGSSSGIFLNLNTYDYGSSDISSRLSKII